MPRGAYVFLEYVVPQYGYSIQSVHLSLQALPAVRSHHYTVKRMNRQTDVPIDPPFGDYTGATTLDDVEIRIFREYIYTYYGECRREFPWRETGDPYEILVSEIMLQQTQTERVVRKYVDFLAKWPSFGALAEATLAEVYAEWRGLGYNRRAKALLDIARLVTLESGGVLPNDHQVLMSLPMVGHATAAAIGAFAFDKATAYLETNIRRVYIYFFFALRTKVHDRELLPLVDNTLDREDPRQWYYALMDYGAYLKKMLPNPNRRSIHYTRQGGFEGSDRQIRGSILRHLGDNHTSSSADLLEGLAYDGDRIKKCLAALIDEGFVVSENAVYRIGN